MDGVELDADDGRSGAREDGPAVNRRGRRGPRPVFVIAVTVNVVLLVIIGTVIVRNIVMASASTEGGSFVIPPSDALNVNVTAMNATSRDSSYSLNYTTVDGVTASLHAMPIGTNTAHSSNESPDPLEVMGRPSGWPRVPFEVEGFTDVVATCLGVGAAGAPTGFVMVPGAEVMAGPPLGAVAIVGGGLVSTMLSLSPGDSCELSPATVERIATVERGLRVVGEAQWYAYVASHSAPVERGSETSSSTDSRLPTVAITDEMAAREAISWAVAGMDRHDADGNYPNLEAGLAPNDYTAMFDEMRSLSNAVPGGTFTVTEIGFLSDDKAVVRYVATADLGGGPQNFPLSGRVQKIDGQWVVTRLTIEDLKNRASITRPPGS